MCGSPQLRPACGHLGANSRGADASTRAQLTLSVEHGGISTRTGSIVGDSHQRASYKVPVPAEMPAKQFHTGEHDMTRQLPKLTALATATLVAGLLHAGPAAADDKRHPGQMCKPLAGQLGNFGVIGGVGIYNRSSTASLSVTCPIIRDEMPQHGHELERVVVEYHNPGHPDTRFHCRTIKSLKTGTLVRAKTAIAPAVGPPGYNQLLMTFPNQSFEITGTRYHMNCILPPSLGNLQRERVMLTNYLVRERD